MNSYQYEVLEREAKEALRDHGWVVDYHLGDLDSDLGVQNTVKIVK